MVKPVSFKGFQKGFQGVSLRGFRGFQFFLWELCVCIKTLSLGEAVCEYAGFHTVALSEQIPVGEGQSFSIVLTYRMADGSSAYAASISYGKEAPNVKEGFFSRYSTAVIGRGESFAFRDGSWADMACRDGLLTLFGDPDVLEEIKAYDLQLDNFNIKVYGIVR